MSEGPTAHTDIETLPAAKCGRRRERGIALLLVLWLLVLLSVMALSFSGKARTQARIARNLYDNAQARWMADAGVRLAVRRLWLTEDSESPAADGTVRFCRFDAGTLAISVQDVAGLIDLNAASLTTLSGLFMAAGAAEEDAHRLAAAVADFRDRDDNPRPGGAEAEAYAAAGLAHGPRNDSFGAIEELGQVLGMPPALLDRILSSVTVHSRRPAADLRTAPPLVRAAYGETDGTAVRQRNIFGAGPRGTFAIIVTARTNSGAIFARRAVVAVSGFPAPSYRVLRWRQAEGPAVPEIPSGHDLPPC